MSAYCYTCHRHLLHSFILRQSSPAIIWAHLAPFYWYSYTHQCRPHYHVAANVAATLYTSQTHQSCRIVTPTLVTLTWLAFSHLSPLPCSIAEPLGLSHCSRFGHVAVTLIALPSVFGFGCCALHWSGDCQHIILEPTAKGSQSRTFHQTSKQWGPANLQTIPTYIVPHTMSPTPSM